jgi:hypothetical protein
MFADLWNYGFPQEMDHFARCVAENEVPHETGEDGRSWRSFTPPTGAPASAG